MNLYELAIAKKLAGGGGGDIDVDELDVTENGTYTAEEGHAYSPVTVDVPNSYAASDEGKVVSNGALVGQTSATKTANGTYDTTLNNEVVVNVPTVTPTGNINITSTAQTDVSAYATAQVVDADLVASNIKKDVDILGVTGTYEGSGGGGSADFAALIDRSITNVVIPDGVTNIGAYVFRGCSLIESISFPSSVVSIGESAFYTAFKYSADVKIVLKPTSAITIAKQAFYYANVGELVIDGSINGFHNTSFQNSTLKSLTLTTPNPPLSNGGIPSSIEHIYVPASAVDTYKAASAWSSFASKIEAIPE